VRVHRLGIETDGIRFLPRTWDGREPLKILIAATFREKKGIPYLVDACRLLRDRGRDFQCRIVGRGNLRPQIARKIRESGLEKRVQMRSVVRQGEVPDLYRSADVFVLPAIVASDGNREGLPVSIVEALACGLPVVSTPVSGISEVVRHDHNGLLVPQGDSWELAEALQRVIDDRSLYERLRNNARPSIMDRFDIRRTSRSLERLFAQEVA
jgi:glycosyltransferase involved in cell wall biosynthesis